MVDRGKSPKGGIGAGLFEFVVDDNISLSSIFLNLVISSTKFQSFSISTTTIYPDHNSRLFSLEDETQI
jgi:hypothetical protein